MNVIIIQGKPVINKVSQKESKSSKKNLKEKRQWDDGVVSKEDAFALDFSAASSLEQDINVDQLIDKKSMGKTTGSLYDAKELDDLHSDSKPNAIFTFFQSFTGTFYKMNKLQTSHAGQKVLDEKDLEPLMLKMREHLIGKNVASEVARVLCEGVLKNMKGTKLGNYSDKFSQFNHIQRYISIVIDRHKITLGNVDQTHSHSKNIYRSTQINYTIQKTIHYCFYWGKWGW